MRKRLIRLAPVQALLAWLAAGYIRLVRATGRWQTIGGEIPAAFWDAGRPFVGCFWHGRLAAMPLVWRKGVPMKMLISQHPDGELIARTIGHFGLGAVRGSTSRGGTAVLRTLVRAGKDGQCLAVTPDGPRGPRMRASDGILALARLSGLPILPVAAAATRRTVFASWDRFVLPLPFARHVVIWGTPMTLAADPDEAAVERARRALEDELNRLSAEADRLCGHAPIAPAEAEPAAQSASGAA